MKQKQNYIPGIYNYCDSWCTQCNFSDRCAVYALEQADLFDEKSKDGEEQGSSVRFDKYFDTHLECFAVTIGDDDIEFAGNDSHEEEALLIRRSKEAFEAPIAKEAEKYSDMVRRWYAENGLLMDVFRLVAEKHSTGRSAPPRADTLCIVESWEIISWYRDLIQAKLIRAILGRGEPCEVNEEEANETPRDSDGSAKVALISIDHSLAAWKSLGEQLTEQWKDIRPITDTLLNLQSSIEGEFPDARLFVRPGFDQER